ncbi:reverse transcriptase domain-containing protein [Desulfococcaceae bacterium HSG8]|nr:reverse transcriptase domain-containing protein [Desulfococcaceae bacterium HSG8]
MIRYMFSRITNHALRITHYESRITNHALRITHYALRITHYALRITLYALRFTLYASRFTHHVSRITFHVSRFTFHVSRITHHVSRITHQKGAVMGNLLEKAASPEVLNAAWRRFRKDKAVWEPGLSRREMERNIGYHLLRLSDELRTDSYIPNPVRFFPVNKGDGRQRIISATTLRDKVAQRAVLNVIEDMGERFFHHDSFGYRPGRTIDMALARVRECMLCGLKWVIDADIEACFDNIPHKPLIRIMQSLISDKELVSLIRRWLDVGAVRRGFLATAKGIPQGSVLSPFLCNVYMTSWDNEMAARNLPFVRFADDFLVFSASREDAEKAYSCVDKALKRLGLSLNGKKTRIAPCGPGVRFLGKKLPKLKRNTPFK